MPESLADKVIVITGSTRGIGRAMAEACAAEGATVVVSSRNAAAVDETVNALRQAGGAVSGIACDVTREADLEALLAHALAEHGRVDVWVNNAGMSLGLRTLLDTTAEEMRTIVETNLISTMVASRLVLKYLLGSGTNAGGTPSRPAGGVLINVSGRGGNGRPGAYTAAYTGTKAGVSVFTKSLAEEHKADPVSILIFMPGMVDTDFYGESMAITPGLEPIADNIRIVIDAIGTPIEAVGPALVEAARTRPGDKSGEVVRVSGGMRSMFGGFKLMWARMSGKMKPM